MAKSYWVFLLAAVLLIISTIALVFGQAWNATRGMKADTEAPNGITVEAIGYTLKLMMALEKTELDPGETLRVNLTVENIGDQNLTMFFSDGNDRSWFTIYNESESESVYTLLIGRPHMHIAEVMEPNATRTENWEWGQVGELVYLGLDYNPPYYHKTITPGEYHIVGLFESSTLNLQIETNPVSFTIHG